jgi:glycosyltransferase involved in cell wall biosynthesis
MYITLYLTDVGQWGELSPKLLEPGGRGLGGRETCLIEISKRLAEAGHEVEVLAPCRPGEYNGVKWRNEAEAYQAGRRAADVAVSFSGANVWARRGLPGKLHVIHEQCAHLGLGRYDQLVDAYLLLSKWQGWHLNYYDPAIDTDKMLVVYNGINPERYAGENPKARHPHRIFYSSSPDRGLHHLLAGWELIRQEIPDAELWIFYSVESWLERVRWRMDSLGRRANLIQPYFDNPPEGITWWGMVDQWELARGQRQCSLWAYPADPTQGTETFCITGLEAAAAGCTMYTTNADCLPEIYGRVAAMAALPTDGQLFAGGVIELLTNEEVAAQYRPGLEFAETYTWDRVANRWLEALESLAAGEWPELEDWTDGQNSDTRGAS